MMIYIVMRTEYDDRCCEGVFSTEEKALACIASRNKLEALSIERFVLDIPGKQAESG